MWIKIDSEGNEYNEEIPQMWDTCLSFINYVSKNKILIRTDITINLKKGYSRFVSYEKDDKGIWSKIKETRSSLYVKITKREHKFKIQRYINTFKYLNETDKKIIVNDIKKDHPEFAFVRTVTKNYENAYIRKFLKCLNDEERKTICFCIDDMKENIELASPV